jgi:aspartate/methionine/tyrosine aminotransferase
MMRWHGQVRCDLASSGIAPVPASDLGVIDLDNPVSREQFRLEIANHFGVAQAEVTPCLGTSGALFTAYACVLGSGGRALVETPVYEPLWRIAEALDRGVSYFERRADSAFQIETERVLSALTADTRLVVVTNPHNPTGAITPAAILAELARELDERGVFLLVDEVYLDTAEPGVTARRLRPNVLACSSATKCWGVPWARLGWLLAPAEIGVQAAHVERCTTGFAPPLAWAMGVRVFERKSALRERTRTLQAGKRALIDAFVERQSGQLSWCPPPPDSTFGWLRDGRGRDLRTLLERAVQETGVFAVPGEFFGDKAALRLAWTSPTQALVSGLPLLEQALL